MGDLARYPHGQKERYRYPALPIISRQKFAGRGEICLSPHPRLISSHDAVYFAEIRHIIFPEYRDAQTMGWQAVLLVLGGFRHTFYAAPKKI